MPRKKITLGYLKSKISKEGIDALTPAEASALVTYKKLGQFGGKPKDEPKHNIIPISEDITLGDGDDDKPLSWYRERLNSVERLCWDKAIEGLASNKAMGKWGEFMAILRELSSRAEISDGDLAVDLCLDPVATSEVEEARMNAG